jgi:hypothetical protein
MLHIDAAGFEVVRDERAVTSPPDSLGAHEHHPLAPGDFEQPPDALAELFGLHMIGIATKRVVSPSQIP